MTAIALVAALLNPASLYTLPGKPVEVVVNAAWAKKQAEPATKLLLLSPTGAIEAQAAMPEGDRFDLGKVLAGVWDGKTHYIQPATEKDAGVGPALVVVPLWPNDPNVRAALVERTGGKPMGLRVYVEHRVVFDTTMGVIVMSLSPEAAPNTTASFMHLVAGGFYDGVTFHRVLAGFVIQGGDPSGTGLGGPGYLLDLETSAKKHKRGVLSMARSSNPDSAGSQFFICLRDGGSVPSLDPRPGSAGYTTFGDVVAGMDVVDKIAGVPVGGPQHDRPNDPPAIKDAALVPAPPRVVTPSGP